MHRSEELQTQICIQLKIPHTTCTTVTERAPTCPKCSPDAIRTADPCSSLILNTSLPPDKFSQTQVSVFKEMVWFSAELSIAACLKTVQTSLSAPCASPYLHPLCFVSSFSWILWASCFSDPQAPWCAGQLKIQKRVSINNVVYTKIPKYRTALGYGSQPDSSIRSYVRGKGLHHSQLPMNLNEGLRTSFSFSKWPSSWKVHT